MTAVLFGSIGSIADTSEIQRAAFNDAFAAHGLDWRWGRAEYLTLLHESGGESRIAAYAAERGESVDAAAVHRTKSEGFRQHLATTGATPRPGVVETIRSARRDGRQVALVTTTSPQNVASMLQATALSVDDFDVVVDTTHVTAAKPDPAAYLHALAALGRAPDECLAIEDNSAGLRAAVAAGVRCIAFPGENTADHDFSGAEAVVDRLDAPDVHRILTSGTTDDRRSRP